MSKSWYRMIKMAQSIKPAADLNKFKEAQAKSYKTALYEIESGMKRSHWMWYIFPQLKSLGMSPVSKHYGISDIKEAEAYLDDPELSERLIEASKAVLKSSQASAERIFGTVDTMKLKSSMTLFSKCSNTHEVFSQVLAKYFGGEEDELTNEDLMD